MKILKKYFIPHKSNEYKPHFLRRESVIFAAALFLLIEVIFVTQNFFLSYTNFFANILPDAIISDTNKSRIGENLSPLKNSEILNKAAQKKAEDMAKNGYFAHISPDGKTPWFWFSAVGYEFSNAGENLAVNFSESKDITKAWMDSPSHRANILSQNFTEIGIGTAKGEYQGRETVFVVQLFGRPAKSNIENSKINDYKTFKEVKAANSGSVSGNDMFVSFEEGSTTAVALGTSGSTDLKKISLIKEAAANPKSSAKYLFLFFGFLVLTALSIKILVKIKIQHPALIFNGFLLLFLLGSMIFLNNELTTLSAKIF